MYQESSTECMEIIKAVVKNVWEHTIYSIKKEITQCMIIIQAGMNQKWLKTTVLKLHNSLFNKTI